MTQDRTYTGILDEMFALRRFGIKLGLSTVRQMLKELGQPHHRFRSIHVAGTNGKGSIASLLAAVLQRAGYRVGRYTSPHLVRFNERICINDAPISDRQVVDAYRAVKQACHGTRPPTFFEFTTVMAFYEFKRQAVDWAVIETGMGGRLDATNVLSPALSIISNISLEHQSYLGNTIERIAAEKGGIIKTATPIVTGATQPKVIAVLRELASRKSAPLFCLGKDFRVRKNRNETFGYFGIQAVWRDLSIRLQGAHQLKNAALALVACEILGKNSAAVPLPAIYKGLAEAAWPGRLEIVTTAPLIILDGAHNKIAAHRLAEYFRDRLRGRPITLVVGILDDKPYKAMLQSLLPYCRRVIVTRPRIDRGLPPETLFAEAQKRIPDVVIRPDVESAVFHAIDTTAAGDAICIAGSLYVVGEAKTALERRGITHGKPSGVFYPIEKQGA